MTTRACTILNEQGDVTIVWGEEDDARMEAIIAKKMAEGITFFIIEPRFGGLAAPRRTKLENVADARDHRALAIKDEDFARFVGGSRNRHRNEDAASVRQDGAPGANRQGSSLDGDRRRPPDEGWLMLQVRPSQLPPDVEYCIDAAVEASELTTAANVALKLYGDAAIIDGLFEKGVDRLGHPIPYSHGGRRSRALAAESYAATLIEELAPVRRQTLSVMGMYGLVRQSAEMAEWLAHCNYEDSTYGGCLQPFRNDWRLTSDLCATPRAARRLHSPRAVRNFLRGIPEVAHLRALFEILIGRAKIGDVDLSIQPELDAINADLEQQYAAVRAAREQAVRQIEAQGLPASAFDQQDVLQASEVVIPTLARSHGLKVRLKKEWTKPERRRRIKRAAATAAAIVGASAVSAFARGLPVVIEGNTVAFAIERRVSLDQISGHGSIGVSVRSLAGHKLASLCVYQDATPPLDQLASIALHVAAGEEDLVLDTGNLFAIERAGHDHPAIRLRIERKLAAAPPATNRSYFNGDNRERFKLHQQVYVRDTAAIYRAALRTIAFGRAAKLIAKIEAAA
jgi:hypothetical protein